MPQTLNTHHSSNFNALFPVKINKMWNFCLILWFFEEPLITETQNLWHWIWHTSNLKYAPFKPFQCVFPSQNQQNVKFFVWNCDFFWNCYLHRLKTCSIGFGICQTLHMCYSSHFNAFVPVKIKQNVKFFVWNCNFLLTTYHRDSKPAVLDLAFLKP